MDNPVKTASEIITEQEELNKLWRDSQKNSPVDSSNIRYPGSTVQESLPAAVYFTIRNAPDPEKTYAVWKRAWDSGIAKPLEDFCDKTVRATQGHTWQRGKFFTDNYSALLQSIQLKHNPKSPTDPNITSRTAQEKLLSEQCRPLTVAAIDAVTAGGFSSTDRPVFGSLGSTVLETQPASAGKTFKQVRDELKEQYGQLARKAHEKVLEQMSDQRMDRVRGLFSPNKKAIFSPRATNEDVDGFTFGVTLTGFFPAVGTRGDEESKIKELFEREGVGFTWRSEEKRSQWFAKYWDESGRTSAFLQDKARPKEQATYTFESPELVGQTGLRELRYVLESMRQAGLVAEPDCGANIWLKIRGYLYQSDSVERLGKQLSGLYEHVDPSRRAELHSEIKEYDSDNSIWKAYWADTKVSSDRSRCSGDCAIRICSHSGGNTLFEFRVKESQVHPDFANFIEMLAENLPKVMQADPKKPVSFPAPIVRPMDLGPTLQPMLAVTSKPLAGQGNVRGAAKLDIGTSDFAKMQKPPTQLFRMTQMAA